MIRHIIREYKADYSDTEYYFDDDGLTEKSGDFCNTLFIVYKEGYGRKSGLNIDKYKELEEKANNIISGFENYGYIDCYGEKTTYKRIMEDEGIEYNSTKAHKLAKWAKDLHYIHDIDDVADFLTIITGEKWDTTSACGYCQGDYVELLYCLSHYKEGVKQYGEVWLGCYKSFGIFDIDENGEEDCGVFGYIVADCEAWRDEDIKKLLCEREGLKIDETQIEFIDGVETHTTTKYRIA